MACIKPPIKYTGSISKGEALAKRGGGKKKGQATYKLPVPFLPPLVRPVYLSDAPDREIFLSPADESRPQTADIQLGGCQVSTMTLNLLRLNPDSGSPQDSAASNP
jgi:hypothetical protein